MDANEFKRNEMLAQQIIKGLQSRNMTGYYAESKEKAKEIALSLMPNGCSVSHGGSCSIKEIGLIDELKSGKFNYINRDTAPDKHQAELDAYDCDVFLGSSNAITEDGVLVNIDGNSNRVSAYAYGPKKVVLIVGMNKVAKDVAEAVDRVHLTATPMNCVRLNKQTPCAVTGVCADCLSPDCICNQVVIIRRSGIQGRIKIILIGEEFGY